MIRDALLQEAQRLRAARLGKEDQATTWAREAVESALYVKRVKRTFNGWQWVDAKGNPHDPR